MSWWNPFKRKAAPPSTPPQDDRNMSEDWAVGDLAECISDQWPPLPGIKHPRMGQILRVTEVNEGADVIFGILIIALGFEGMGNMTWDNRSFRKLRPTIDPAEEEFTVWLKDELRKPVGVD